MAIRQDVLDNPRPGQPAEYSLLTEELPAPIAYFDADARYQHVNRAYEAFFGCSREAISGRTIQEIAGKEHYATATPYIERALRGEQVSFLSCARHAGGSLREIEVRFVPRMDEGGGVTGFVSLIQCGHDRNADAEARARLAAIVDSSDDAIVSKTLDGVITSWNGAAERIFGYTADEAIGQHIYLIVPADKRDEEDDVLARLRRGEKIDHFETLRRAKDGRVVSMSLSVSPIRNAHGQIIGAAKVARDITQRIRDERALRESEHYRKAVMQSMPECLKVLDRDGTVIDMNAAGLRMVEASGPEDVIGKCVYSIIEDRDREAFRRVNESVFRGEPGGTLEFAIRGLKGARRSFETNVAPLRSGTDEIIGALSVTRDITGRKQAELRDAFLLRLDDETRPLADPQLLAQAAARLLAEHLRADRCSYAEIDLNKDVVDVIGNYSPNMRSIVGRYRFASFGSGFQHHMMAGLPYVFRDSAQELGPDALPAYEVLGTRAVISIPLIKGERLVAGLAVHQASPRDWTSDEIDLVQNVANRCWESLQRARVERELRASEEQFRTLADAIPNLAWMAHADGYLFWYNRRWYDYTGTTPRDMEGWGWQNVHDPEVLPKVVDRWKVSLERGEPFEMIFPLRGADGQFRSFLTRVEPIKDGTGRVIRWFGTNTDITAQQEAELREKKSRETAELLNHVGPVLAAELDQQKLAQKITDMATEAVGAQFGAFFHTRADDSGESYVLYTLSGVPREAFAGFPMPRNTAVFGPTFRGEPAVRSDDITRDPRYGRNPPYHGMPAGHLPVRSYLAIPVVTRTGAVVGGLFFGHSEAGVFTQEAEDIVAGIAAQAAIALDNASLFDEAKRASEALLRSNEQLKRLNDDLNQFAYSASHDLREPLRMVALYTQFLGRKLAGALDEEGETFLQYIRSGALRMEALVRDLLAYTQAAASAELPAASADTNEALRAALENLATNIEGAGARVSFSQLPAVGVPAVQLTQLLQNLVGNAIKYRSAAPPEIRIDAVRREETWVFSVEDNGIGIDDAYKEQIFGVFKRLHTNDEYPGTGIGLAICQRIVQRAGGRIWVESQPGGGSTFFFTLPANV